MTFDDLDQRRNLHVFTLSPRPHFLVMFGHLGIQAPRPPLLQRPLDVIMTAVFSEGLT